VNKLNGDRLSWKDLRSGMACHLLRSGWSRDEVNARLGHTAYSAALNAYINYLGLDRGHAKRNPQSIGPTHRRSLPKIQFRHNPRRTPQ